MRIYYKEMRNPSPPKVAIVYPASVPWLARCLDGVRRYAREQGGWHLFSSPPTLPGTGESGLTLNSLRGWKGDALIVVAGDAQALRDAKALQLPVVNLAGGVRDSGGIPRVMVDHFLAGRLAADHLLGCGLRHLAFFGWKELWYSEQRRLGFDARAAESGAACHVFLRTIREDGALNWPRRIASVADWLKSLPRPCGVFAVHDYRAQLLVEACQDAGLRIPDDIAVIGMDNDETVCEHSVPTLTSVSRSSEQVGWEAAALLHRMMQGGTPPTETLLIAPEGVVARQSTDMHYYMDPVVRRAVDYMKENLKGSFNIATIAESLGVSKRTLEMRFRESVASSPHAYFTWLRVQRAQAMMQLSQKRPLEHIATECGFGTGATFYAAFQRVTGQTPARFRKKRTGK